MAKLTLRQKQLAAVINGRSEKISIEYKKCLESNLTTNSNDETKLNGPNESTDVVGKISQRRNIEIILYEWRNGYKSFNSLKLKLTKLKIVNEGNLYFINVFKISAKKLFFKLILLLSAYPFSKYFGRVVYNDLMFIKENWILENTKVICKSLYSEKTIASTIDDSIFLPLPSTSELMNSPKCNGQERSINDCPGLNENVIKNEPTAAAIHCLTNLTNVDFRLVESNTNDRTGLVYLSETPVCMNKAFWKLNAHSICTQKYGNEKFQYIVYGDAVEINQINSEYFITNLTCNWNDIQSGNESCSISVSKECKDLIGVRCAKCIEPDLLESLKLIQTEGSQEAIIDSFKNSLDDLLEKCQKWDCSGTNHQYPDYCRVYNFITDSRHLSDTNQLNPETIKISSFAIQFDILKHHFFKESFSKISADIKEMSDKITSSIGKYFLQMAQFDSSIADSDLVYAKSVWDSSNKAILSKQETLSKQLIAIFDYAEKFNKFDLVETALGKAVSNITNLLNPLKWFSNPDLLNDVLEGFKLIKSFFENQQKIEIEKSQYTEQFEGITKELGDKVKGNENSYKKIYEIINKAKMHHLSLDEARSFLQEYDSFTPAISKQKVAEYTKVIEQILDKLCDIIESHTSVLSTLLNLLRTARELCPLAKTNMAVVIGMYDEMENQQSEIMVSFARLARSILSKQGAIEIYRSVRENKTGVELEVFKLKSIFMIRQRKIDLIKKACDQLKYMNHGEEEAICTELLKNFDSDIGPLIYSPLGGTSMCNCPNCQSKEGVFLIPAYNDDFNTSNAMNTMNLFSLYSDVSSHTNGTIYFRIPDVHWLRKFKWISDFDEGPFFLQKFSVYLPPQSKRLYEYQIKIQLVETKLGNQSYTFQDGLVIENRFTVNPLHSHCSNAIDNPYSFEDIQKSIKVNIGTLCINTEGIINGLALPSLEGSTWRITLESKPPLKKLHPAKETFIKAHAKFCFRSLKKIPRNIYATTVNGERREMSAPHLCPEKQYFDVLHALDSENDNFQEDSSICKNCPSFSLPRLFGYFCEQCPKGFTTSKVGYYGCDPCKVNEFKNEIGPGPCKKCKGKETTGKTVGASNCLTIITNN